MAIINSELTVAAQKSIDGKMFKIVGVQHVPYDSIADVLSNIVSTRRHIGQVFRYIDGGGISDCHFIGGIADINLVKIDYGSGSGIGLENAATFAGISGSGQRVVIVAADENNNGDKSLYIYNGTSLIFITTIP